MCVCVVCTSEKDGGEKVKFEILKFIFIFKFEFDYPLPERLCLSTCFVVYGIVCKNFQALQVIIISIYKLFKWCSCEIALISFWMQHDNYMNSTCLEIKILGSIHNILHWSDTKSTKRTIKGIFVWVFHRQNIDIPQWKLVLIS